MLRIRIVLPWFFPTLAVVILALAAAIPAGAQNTINQTSCGGVTGVNSCLSGGFLQDLTVNCSMSGPAGQVNTTLAQITDRNGPNRIKVSGTCNVGVTIAGFNRLAIEGPATLTQAWTI